MTGFFDFKNLISLFKNFLISGDLPKSKYFILDMAILVQIMISFVPKSLFLRYFFLLLIQLTAMLIVHYMIAELSKVFLNQDSN